MVHQRDSNTRKKYLTFMVLPHNSAKEVFRINLPSWAAAVLGGVVSVIVIIIVGSFIFSASLTARLVKYYSLKAENKYQTDQINRFIDKTKELEDSIRELEERDQELREMLGLQAANRKRSQLPPPQDLIELDKRLADLLIYVEKRKEAYANIKPVAQSIAQRFENTPSLWPVDGQIRSQFGWRVHPFTGSQELHAGIDIPMWVGCPVRSAADGVVSYSGWLKGYGYTVMVNHNNEYTTLYGHNQRTLVKSGQRVYKGQVIAKIGSTGLSTGPHCHYEVRYKNKAIYPNRFLDLKIQSAQAVMGNSSAL